MLLVPISDSPKRKNETSLFPEDERFTPELEDKFSAKISKLSKFIEQRGEREAHVIASDSNGTCTRLK